MAGFFIFSSFTIHSSNDYLTRVMSYARARVFPGPGEHARPADDDEGGENTRCRTSNVAQYAAKTHRWLCVAFFAIVYYRLRHIVQSLIVRSYCSGICPYSLARRWFRPTQANACDECDEYAVVALGYARVNIDSFTIWKVAMGIDFHTAATGTKTKPIHPPKCTISTTYFTRVKSGT